MELNDVIAGRRMVRSFAARPVDPGVIDHLCDLARRAPSAGHSQGVSFIVLEGPDVARYWDVTLPEPRRSTFRWPGLVAAPALVVVAVDPGAYVTRYAEADKSGTGLGDGPDAWPVPYWWVDAGAAIEHLLLGAVDVGLGACLFGLFHHESAVAQELDVPVGHRLVGTVALGHPDPSVAEPPGRSSNRPRRPLGDVVHRGDW